MPRAGDAGWWASPARLLWLVVGLLVFGVGEALVILGTLGNSPWSVLAEGVGEHTGIGIGTATIVLSVLVLLLWIPLRQAPGLGTVLNAILIGVAMGVLLEGVAPPEALPARVACGFGGIAVVGLGAGMYLTAALGPGPRDGLMTGLHRRTGRSLAVVRTGIELSVLVAGVLLGGTVGVTTAAFALLVGPAVQHAVRVVGPRAPRR